jgi:mono/diheme cytochrome c family protein
MESAMMVNPILRMLPLAAAALLALPAAAATPAERGKRFFSATHGGDWSCATCHTKDPLAQGRHAVTGKDIAPLAPAANPKRFTDPAKVEKWFGRNCKDVLHRACTPREKGDFTAYVTSLSRVPR